MDNRELDRAVAERFLEWHSEKKPNDRNRWYDKDENPQLTVIMFQPSSDPAACSLVLDEIERRGWGWKLEYFPYPDKVFRMTIYTLDAKSIFAPTSKNALNRYMTICLAALQAAEGKTDS